MRSIRIGACLIFAALVILAGSHAAASDPPPPGLIHHWTGNGTFNDSVGTNHGTPANGVGFAAGHIGQGFEFDGVDDHVQVAKNTFDGLRDLTIDAWVRLDEVSGEQTIIGALRNGDGINGHIWSFLIRDQGKIQAIRQNCVVKASIALQPGVFHHVAVTRVGSTISLYVDGVDVTAGASTHGDCGKQAPVNPGTTAIGSHDPLVPPLGPARPLDGVIDELRIFNRGLSAQEIENLFTGGSDPADRDGDGFDDVIDAFPDDPNEWFDSDSDGVGDNADAFPEDASETADSDGDGVGDNADTFPQDPNETADSDGDGVGDNADAFDASVPGGTVVIGTCDSGVANQQLASPPGAFFNDLIGAAAASARNHGSFVSQVTKLAKDWQRERLISGKEKGKITACAAQSDIGK